MVVVLGFLELLGIVLKLINLINRETCVFGIHYFSQCMFFC